MRVPTWETSAMGFQQNNYQQSSSKCVWDVIRNQNPYAIVICTDIIVAV